MPFDMRPHSIIPALLLCVGTACGEATDQPAALAVATSRVVATTPHPREIEFKLISPVFHVNQIFKSMVGPQITHPFRISKATAPELFWLTGYAVEVVGSDGHSLESMDYECPLSCYQS